MKRVFVACVAVLSLAGCASMRPGLEGPLGRPGPASPFREAGGRDDAPICRMEQRTGTHVPREVCRTEAEEALERARAEELLLLGLQRGEILIP